MMASSGEVEQCPINELPELVLVHIFSYLSIDERHSLEETCLLWCNIIRRSHRLAFTCTIHLHALVEDSINPLVKRLGRVLRTRPHSDQPKACATTIDPRPYGYIQQYLKRFRNDIKNLYIDIEQHDASCRYVLCRFLSLFGQEQCSDQQRQIRSFRLRFISHNPLLMQSHDITQALRTFFHYDTTQNPYQSLVSCDLSGLTISLDDDTVLLLAKHHPRLRTLNLQDQSLVCLLTPFCILRTLDVLEELEDLWVDMISMTDEFILMLLGDDEQQQSNGDEQEQHERKPTRSFRLKHLGLRVRREEKFSDEVDVKLWPRLSEKYPHLRMTLNFDLTTPLNRIRAYMKADLKLPVETLIINTPIPVADELYLATNSFCETLKHVHICTSGQWAAMTRTPAFNQAVLYLAERCVDLRTLYVDVALEETIIEIIFELHPHLREPGASKLLLVDSPTHTILPEDMADLFG